MHTFLSVDTNLAVHEEHAVEWSKHGMSCIRVNSMSKAITNLKLNDVYRFVSINEDSIPNFIEHLPTMRKSTCCPIFIFTSSYTIEKKLAAINKGADLYDAFASYVKADVLDVIETMELQDRWTKRPSNELGILICGDVIMCGECRNVYVREIKVPLTKKEFDILQYLLLNKGIIVKHSALINEVWGDEHESMDRDMLWNAVRRLRLKLKVSTDCLEYIQSVREVGYSFTYN